MKREYIHTPCSFHSNRNVNWFPSIFLFGRTSFSLSHSIYLLLLLYISLSPVLNMTLLQIHFWFTAAVGLFLFCCCCSFSFILWYCHISQSQWWQKSWYKNYAKKRLLYDQIIPMMASFHNKANLPWANIIAQISKKSK